MSNNIETINKICEKYGNSEDVRNAVIDAFKAKEREFAKYHKPVYETADFKKYKRHLIQLRPDTVMLIHLFSMDGEHNFEKIWLDDNEECYVADYECIKDAAKQLLMQLEGHYCDLFIEELKKQCEEILENSYKRREEMKKNSDKIVK